MSLEWTPNLELSETDLHYFERIGIKVKPAIERPGISFNGWLVAAAAFCLGCWYAAGKLTWWVLQWWWRTGH